MIKENKFVKLVEKVIQDKPKLKARTQQSLDWFRKKIEREFGTRSAEAKTVFDINRPKTIALVGQIISFEYNPKTKNTLEYYDKFPLTLILSYTPNGFLGLNFHYLKPLDRAKFMGNLYKYIGKTRDQITINIDYTKLSKLENLGFYKPCIKRYLFKNMSSRVAIIQPEEWDLTLFLPTEKFVSYSNKSTTKNKIWEASTKIARKK